jgi:Hydrazine synthase alpha subunit middle domain
VRTPHLLALAVVSPLLAGCSEPTPRQRFEEDVVPVLEGHCAASSCHGVSPLAEAQGEIIDWTFLHFAVHEDGTIADIDAAYEAAKSRINTVEHPQLSSLLRKPLAADRGGLVHLGGTQFRDRTTEPYERVLDWIGAENEGGEGAPLSSLTPLQRQFARDVLPELAARQCMNAACHGAFAPFTSFAAPVVIDGAPVFSVAAIRDNYTTARHHLYLGGDTSLSRLLRKVLPVGHGGIAHRGGNAIFFGAIDSGPSRALLDWAEAEKREVLGDESTAPSGVVFVRGPVGSGGAFDHDLFQPGTDLWVLEPPEPGGALRNLTASAHPDGEADVRDPTVRHDATRIAFAMRRSLDDAFNIYEIGVHGGGLRQLTFDEGALPTGGQIANVQPTYGPDGRVFFASTRAGMLADGFDVLDSEIWAVDPEDGTLERITHTPSPEVTPSFIGQGKTYGTLAFTMRRTVGGRYEAPVLRTPLDHNRAYHGDPEIHIHHGVTAGVDIVYGMRTLPDGRHSCILLGRDNQWRAGRLAVFDRQLGPDLPRGQEAEAAVGGFRHAFTPLGEDGEPPSSPTGAAYRHPVPLPDGRLLVSRAGGPLDLEDGAEDVDFGLYLATIEESADSGEPRLASVVPLLDDPSVAEYDAEPIVVRPLEDDPEHEPDWDAARLSETGTLALRHVETLESIFTNPSQSGEKTLRDDLVYLRVVESLPVGLAEQANTPIGLGVHGRNRVLGEVELRGGSAYLQLPADTPFRLQYLDENRMAIGAQHNRWIHIAPGEKFPGGVTPELYPTLCAGCHGALSGDRADVGGPPPDIVTAASVTLATHDNLNPRRPLDPVPVGNEPISVDFRTDVAPLLARSCAHDNCHAPGNPAAGLSLESSSTPDFDSAYEALLQPGPGSGGGRRYVDERGSSSRRSYLIERIVGRELDAPRALDGSCVGEPPLSDAERLMFVRWIDLGAVYRGTAP